MRTDVDEKPPQGGFFMVSFEFKACIPNPCPHLIKYT